MSGYIEAGYVIALGSLSTYAISLVTRERAARRRLPPQQAEPRSVASEGPEVNGASS